ncbi:Uma2 family endonuclease [Streptomyces shenzhenensis]|uniref:Uma2 family endonuclease n=1 Tax=Streptomyces shenzhenensis TaxID=943815 RepID=UPI0033EDF35A
MSAEPIMEPVMTQVDPIDLLIAFEKAASPMPIRAEYIEETGIVPPQPDEEHSDGIAQLFLQFNGAGFHLVGFGMGFHAAQEDGRTAALVIPDFYVRRRKATEWDEAHSKAHKGWYSMDMLALVGEVTSSNHWADTSPKLRAYAAAAVPVYVLINRHTATAHCHTGPVLPGEDAAKAYYSEEDKVDLGAPLPLPAPYPALDTTPFRTD